MRGGNALAARLLARSRYEKPSPGPSQHADTDLEEHHVIPYDKLKAFGDRLAASGQLRAAAHPLVTPWSEVTVGELLRLHVLRDGLGFEGHEEELAEAQLETLRAEPPIITLTADGRSTRKPNLSGPEQRRYDALVLAKQNRAHERTPGPDDEVPKDLLMSHLTWAHGNLFSGPRDRVWKADNRFDDYASYVMPERVARLRVLNTLIDGYHGGGANDQIRAAMTVLAEPRVAFARDAWTLDGTRWRPNGAPEKGPPVLG